MHIGTIAWIVGGIVFEAMMTLAMGRFMWAGSGKEGANEHPRD